jgi:hypothetical protein
VLTPKSDFNRWWNNCIDIAEENVLNSQRKRAKTEENTYVRLIQMLLMLSRVNLVKPIHTRSGASARLSEDMKSLGTIKNRVLWTTEQFKIIYGSAFNVFFNSRFGTGKTLLLQTKCLNVANGNKNSTAYYIVMPAVVEQLHSTHSLSDVPKLPTLIELEAESLFEKESKYNNAIVKTWSEMAKEFPRQRTPFGVLLEFIRKNGSNASFFIDEYHEGYKKSQFTNFRGSCLLKLVNE